MNIKRVSCTLLVSSVISFSHVSSAQDQERLSDEMKAMATGWSGTANIGFTNAGGNSEARSLSGGIRLGKSTGLWRHIVFGSVLSGESTILVERRNDLGEVEIDPTTNAPIRDIIKGDNAERYALGYQPRYQWKKDTYLFGIIDWEQIINVGFLQKAFWLFLILTI
jgi:putative salt-induced outer membrane protein YdiY